MNGKSAPVSAVVIAKNEGDFIGRCLESLSWCDEVLVVDDHSADDTAAVARWHGARVLQHAFRSFADQRNWALEQGELRNEWVLMFDVDEVSTREFEAAVRSAVAEAPEEVAAFALCRATMFQGKWIKRADGFPVWIMRLVRRGRAWFQDSGHGEVRVPAVDGRVDRIREPFLHFPFQRGLEDWIARHVRYAEREAIEELRNGHHVDLRDFFRGSSARRDALRNFSRKLPARPTVRFLYQYFWKRGILDGRAGYEFCRLMAFYEFLIGLKKRELRARGRAGEKSLEEKRPRCGA